MAGSERGKKIYRWTGDNGTVTWDQGLCIHVGECTRSGELFESGREPWCRPDAGSPGELADVVHRCPTGALVLERDGRAELGQPPEENTVTVANNGPLYVHGDLDLEGAPDDRPGLKRRAALCRCGLSKSKPYCDNSHEDGGFTDRGAVGETGPGIEGPEGKLTVKRAPNGPLLLNGPYTIVAASGRRAWQGKKAALCRCGASQNKPFCDGAHKAAGFEAD